MKAHTFMKMVTKSGSHFFTPNAMRFFRSRMEIDAVKVGDGRYMFITSEQFDEEAPRLYTVRSARLTKSGLWTIDTVGDFQAHETIDDALAAAMDN